MDKLANEQASGRAPSLEEPVRLADKAYAGIVALIAERNLQPGDRLPSEAALAESFGISRSILREALVRLAADGITQSRRGAGSFVKSRPSDRLGSHMPMGAMAQILGSYEVRFVLESEAARLAAMRRTDQQMALIEEAMAALARALPASGPAHEEDLALHRAIFQATGNPMFPAALEAMHAQIEPIMRAGVDISRSRPSAVIAAMLSEHEQVVEAIRTQDADGAALAMRWHLTQGRKRLMP